MTTFFDFKTAGLSQSQFDKLSKLAHMASTPDSDQLLIDVRQHFEQTRVAQASNQMVNLRLASAIVDVIERVSGDWDSLSDNCQIWLAAAIQYFSDSNDDEPDFKSPIGFEDDVEVLNACLRFAKLGHLCINVEDYDDA